MSFPISDEDAAYLRKMILEGKAIPMLGAGASVTSVNSRGQPIPMSNALAAQLCAAAAIDYENDGIKDVLDTIIGEKLLSTTQITNVLMQAYKGCRPSPEMEALLSYTWRRIYLWNIDDLIENIRSHRVQTVRSFNGMIDKAVEFEGLEYLHTVYLHGQITRPEHRFIFTEEEYNGALTGNWHHWYKRLAQDYFTSCPIIIGSSLDEPILSAEIDRVKRENDSQVGRAFLIIPTELTPIKVRALRSRGIVHVNSTLEGFVRWLRSEIPGGSTPTEILRNTSAYSESELDKISRSDVATAHSLQPISVQELQLKARGMSEANHNTEARKYMNGFNPTWSLIASDIPIILSATKSLKIAFDDFLRSEVPLFVAIGQSGGGKTSSIMQSIVSHCVEKQGVHAFELSPNVKSVPNAIRLLHKLHPEGAILYIPDLFVFGDTFIDDLDALKGTGIRIVSSARTNEWKDRLSRYLGSLSRTFVFERFNEEDIDPIIDKILKYVPAPKFRKLRRDDQRKRLRSSKSQLLIALKEATESDEFSNIIANEYDSLPDKDTKNLLLMVGISTIARVGISQEMARETYARVSSTRPFDKAVDALAGIVNDSYANRLNARHELYVRHILENVVSFESMVDTIVAMLKYYVKYNIPIVRSVSRLDSLLFRFMLNHKFITENERRKKADRKGIKIYEAFEVDFQLDGHFWLQYGLYLANRNEISLALKMLRRSIDAYPDNIFAVHAYADIQLRYAAGLKFYDTRTKNLIGNAVETLKKMDAETSIDVDVYPIVTLVNGHISALIKHNETDEARRVAKDYFDRLKVVEKFVHSSTVTNARERVLKFVTLGEWQERYMVQPTRKSRHKGQRRRRSLH